MANALEVFVGLSWLVSLVLDIGAAWYAYRIKTITGGFKAWWLMIFFAISFAVSSFFSVSYSVLSESLQTTSPTTALTNVALFDVGLGLLLSLLLLGSMVELYRIFRGQNKSGAHSQETQPLLEKS